MKERKAKFLLKMYPQFFTSFLNRGKHAHHQLSVGDGWYPLMFDLCARLFSLQYEVEMKKQSLTLDCVQLKEKMGGLRFYYDVKVTGESQFSILFQKIDQWCRTQLCKRGLYKQYWAIYRFRRKYIYETISEKVNSIVSAGESLSYRTCEVCGAIGERCTPNGHWIETLCERHEKEAKSKREKGDW